MVAVYADARLTAKYTGLQSVKNEFNSAPVKSTHERGVPPIAF